MVPILIKVQQLQRRLINQPDNFGTAWNWVDAFLCLEYHDQPAVYRFLRQALLSRRVLLLIDGLDEGGAKRDEIQRHVTEVLAKQGHVMLCTSRPASVTESSFPGFRRLHLSPLTEQQQQEALEQRLGAPLDAPRLEYLKRMPVGYDGLRVTANPLMLSMIASVYELRQGVGMPETIAELYEHASEAMLSRGGASSRELRRLMQAVFFEAHVAERRVIEDRHLDAAALSLELPKVLTYIRERAKGKAEKGRALRDACDQLSPLLREALKQMRQRVANDKLPLFSLLETEPLKLQSSHLSFQEYFAARKLCEEGTCLSSGVLPWQWSAWWQNAVKLGSEMDGFGSGMLRAAGVQGDALSLSRELSGHQPTVLKALCEMLKGSQIVKLKRVPRPQPPRVLGFLSVPPDTQHVSLLGSVDGHALQIDKLKGTKPTKKIDLSGKGLSVASAIIIASCIKENGVLKELMCAAAPECSLFLSAPIDTPPFPWQFDQQPSLHPQLSWPRDLQRRGHHQAVRGSQGERRDLAQVRRRPKVFAFLSMPTDAHLHLHLHSHPHSHSHLHLRTLFLSFAGSHPRQKGNTSLPLSLSRHIPSMPFANTLLLSSLSEHIPCLACITSCTRSQLNTHTPVFHSTFHSTPTRDAALHRALREPRPRPPVGRVGGTCSRAHFTPHATSPSQLAAQRS